MRRCRKSIYQLEMRTTSLGNLWFSAGAAIPGTDEMVISEQVIDPGASVNIFRLLVTGP